MKNEWEREGEREEQVSFGCNMRDRERERRDEARKERQQWKQIKILKNTHRLLKEATKINYKLFANKKPD